LKVFVLDGFSMKLGPCRVIDILAGVKYSYSFYLNVIQGNFIHFILNGECVWLCNLAEILICSQPCLWKHKSCDFAFTQSWCFVMTLNGPLWCRGWCEVYVNAIKGNLYCVETVFKFDICLGISDEETIGRSRRSRAMGLYVFGDFNLKHPGLGRAFL
jgi:hypothetical protein